MKIAIPLSRKSLSSHFGQADAFALYTLSDEKAVLSSETLTPPPHEPGSYPRWLAGLGVKVLLAGGMGGRALTLFRQAGIEVFGNLSSSLTPDEALNLYQKGLLSGAVDPVCDHGGHGHSHGHSHGNCGGH